MKSLFLIVIVFLFSSSASSGDRPPAQNTYVQFHVQIKEKSLKPGATGELLISLRPQEGIHINLQPAIDVKLDSSALVTLVGKMEVPRQSAANYLDASMPIRQEFMVPKSAQSGNMRFRGTITYYYCSDAEGWCSRFKQAFLVDLTVARSSQ